MTFIYLDNNATTRPAAAVVEAMTECLRESWANPSSIHRAGQAVRQRVELARESVAKLVGCSERDLIFTSGGTESANLAIMGSLHAQRGRRVVVTSRLEHSAVRETAHALAEQGVEIVWIGSSSDGLVDLDELSTVLERRHAEIALVSIMWANNETGVVQPVERIGELCRARGVRFHSDATQWVGRMPVQLQSLPIDLLSFAAHKFHGPKGVGGLAIRRGVRITREIVGGPQERDRRGGTENVPGIVGMGVAAELARAWLATDDRTRLAAMRDSFEHRLRSAIPECRVNGAASPRIWSTTNIGFPRLEAEALLLLLSEKGLCASAGAACSSGSLDPSPVLLAMGVPAEIAHGSIRLSLSRDTTEGEIDQAAAILIAAVARLGRSSARVLP